MYGFKFSRCDGPPLLSFESNLSNITKDTPVVMEAGYIVVESCNPMLLTINSQYTSVWLHHMRFSNNTGSPILTPAMSRLVIDKLEAVGNGG